MVGVVVVPSVLSLLGADEVLAEYSIEDNEGELFAGEPAGGGGVIFSFGVASFEEPLFFGFLVELPDDLLSDEGEDSNTFKCAFEAADVDLEDEEIPLDVLLALELKVDIAVSASNSS